ncbi:MAG: iron uptake porin [Okeania sp. SIO3B5]|uniref:iron uptake porin n=1 Tax=Okeania sp. SIO3B5 TaxID=2607811 RepID=UPI0013FF64E3|nr:iron uptake porin [Okeania sp. SIO3B5]NEO56486.1 iron uptake porin [Okeania sp. SIO3B5]
MKSKFLLSLISIFILGLPLTSAKSATGLTQINSTKVKPQDESFPYLLPPPKLDSLNNSQFVSSTVRKKTLQLAQTSDEYDDLSELDQVTSVSQLSDIQPTDWAFQALQSLVERYGCIAGYPDGTYKGNRAMTRYEFAAGLNACLDRMTELIDQSTVDLASREDMAAVQRLVEEFAPELAALRGRIDVLEARTAELEANRFNGTTTIFGGEVIFGLTNGFGGEDITNAFGGRGDGDKNTIFNYLVRLQTATTFTGKDRLRIELGAANFSSSSFAGRQSFNTDMAILSYQTNTTDELQIFKLEYRFPAFGDRVVFTFRPVNFSLNSVLTANSPYFDAGRGSISRFTDSSPIFKIGRLDSGLGFDWLVTDKVRLQVAYGTRDSEKPGNGPTGQGGITDAGHSAVGVQFLTVPFDNVLTGVTYINAYSEDGYLDTFTGSLNADTSGGLGLPANINAVGGTVQWRVWQKITLGAWGGWVFTDYINSDAHATSNTYLFSVGMSDPFGRQGDLFAVLFGKPLKLVDGDNGIEEDENTSYHIETFYRYKVNDYITITPGVFVVTNPEHNEDNETIVIGVLRTTFRF